MTDRKDINPRTNANRRREEANQEIRITAYNLRLAGWPYHAIGKELNRSEQTVRMWIKQRIERLSQIEAEKLEEIRQTELDRLDKLQVVVDRSLLSHDHRVVMRAVDRAIKIQESRRKLLGMDAAERLNVEIEDRSQAEIDLDKLIAEANKRFGQEREEMKGRAEKE